MVAADGRREFAEATGNPLVLFRRSLPTVSLSAMQVPSAHSTFCAGAWHDRARRRQPLTDSILVLNLARLEAEHADPLAALDHITLAIRNYHDSGNTSTMRSPLAILATLFDRLRRRLSQAERPMHSTSGHAAVRLQPFWSELVFTACTYATTARA